MNIWNGEENIIEDSGKNATCQLFLTERIPETEEINRSVIIEEGNVVEKPDDIDIIGKRTSKGFIIRGIELNTRKTKRCSICGEYKNIKNFWDKDRDIYSNVCNECRENSYANENGDKSECWIR